MTIAGRLSEMIHARQEWPRQIVLGPRGYLDLCREMSGLYQRVSDDGIAKLYFMGLPVVLEIPSAFCRSCGAPAEPNECSYCRRPSETITVEP